MIKFLHEMLSMQNFWTPFFKPSQKPEDLKVQRGQLLCWRNITSDIESNFKNIANTLNTQVSLLSMMPPMGESFDFHVLVLMMHLRNTAWIVPKYGVFSSPYFSVFSPNTGKYGPEKTPYLDTLPAVEIKKFCTCKATKSNVIPVNILKQNVDIFLTTFATIFNFCVNEGKVPNNLNPFVVNFPILYTPKAPENVWFSVFLREYKMGTLVTTTIIHKIFETNSSFHVK